MKQLEFGIYCDNDRTRKLSDAIRGLVSILGAMDVDEKIELLSLDISKYNFKIAKEHTLCFM